MKSTALTLLGFTLLAGSLEAQTWGSFQTSRALQSEQELRVTVNYGAGRFILTPIDTDHLYRMRLRYDEESFEPVHTFESGRLSVGVTGSPRRSSLRRVENESELELLLSRRVALDLRLEFGAVRADVDLGGLRLRELQLTTGASDSRIRVSRPNPESMERAIFRVGAAAFEARELGNLNAATIEVEAGVGDVKLDLGGLIRGETRLRAKIGMGGLEIRVPPDVGIRLVRSTFLTSVNAPGLTRDGDAYYSSNWSGADRRVFIEVDAAVGSVSILRAER